MKKPFWPIPPSVKWIIPRSTNSAETQARLKFPIENLALIGEGQGCRGLTLFNRFEDNLNTITLIEWPEIIQKKPEKLIELFFKYEDGYQKRSVQIKGLKL